MEWSICTSRNIKKYDSANMNVHSWNNFIRVPGCLKDENQKNYNTLSIVCLQWQSFYFINLYSGGGLKIFKYSVI